MLLACAMFLSFISLPASMTTLIPEPPCNPLSGTLTKPTQLTDVSTMRADLSDIIFTTAWRSHSYQAIPIMFTEYDLDVDDLLPRALCPKVYDQVQKLVSDMGWDAQYAVWMWHEVREESGRLNWHPHLELPFSRRIVVIEEKEEKGLPTVAK
jgi:hypothetical protein